MVLIISSKEDYSTSSVIKWLIKLNVEFIRLNENDIIEILNLTRQNFVFVYNHKTYSLNDFNSIWYRRGWLNFKMINDLKYLKDENNEIKNYIYKLLSDKRHINTFFNAHINKLFVLSYNKFKFIQLPEYCVTQSKEIALEFFHQNDGKIISKPVYVPYKTSTDESLYMAYTAKIRQEDFEGLSEHFVPTFFQKYVNKKFEIRTFYLDSKFYSMCIFSQSNTRTEVDFRNYDNVKPNRVSPFKLPDHIENELIDFLNKFRLDCASLDIIYDGKEFYLLDVNPVGQFGMVSRPCNYSLERKIAEFLIK